MLSYNAEPKKLRKFGKVLNNSIFIAKLLFESSNCVLPILVLLEILRTLEDYLATLKIYPFLKYGKLKRGRVWFKCMFWGWKNNRYNALWKKDIRVRIKTMTVIENLPITNTDNHESLLSCLSNRDISVVSSLTGSSGKVSGGRRKVEKNLL